MELTFDACPISRRLDGGFNRARVCLPALLVTMIRLLKSSSAGPSYLIDVVTCGEEGSQRQDDCERLG